MAGFNIVTRRLSVSNELQEALERYVVEEKEVKPGQLRKREGWYYLTYLKVVKVKNFNAEVFDLVEMELDCIRVTVFQIRDKKLLVRGGKSEVKEIKDLLEALALKLAGNSSDESVDFDKYYKLDLPTVDLDQILKAYEGRRLVADVRKLVLKDMEVRIGSVKRCVIETNDYGGVRKLLEAPDNQALAVEIAFKQPEKTYLMVDLEGAVKANTHSAETDFDLSELAIECALML